MNTELKRMNYSELEELNEKGEVGKEFLHYDIYKNAMYLGTIIKIDNDVIIIDTSRAATNHYKPTKKKRQMAV